MKLEIHWLISIGPSSANHSIVVHIPNYELVVVNFHEIHYKMSELGHYFSMYWITFLMGTCKSPMQLLFIIHFSHVGFHMDFLSSTFCWGCGLKLL
jgi:hypothetical protein